jgi:hypothetical protein
VLIPIILANGFVLKAVLSSEAIVRCDAIIALREWGSKMEMAAPNGIY